MKTKKLGVNVVLNIVKTVMSILFPLITYPYVSRILQPENIGKVNYITSIVSYFLLIAMLGISVYATREGAQIRDEQEKIEKFVSEVFSINIISGVVSLVLLLVAVFIVPGLVSYKYLIFIIGCQIPFSVLGSDWINSIYEDYLYITIRTIIFQLIAMIMMFICVRNKNDYMQYAVCTIISGYGAQLLNVFYTKKHCKKKFTFSLNMKQHAMPIMLLFATNLSSLIYSNMDTTMLGYMTSDYNVGIYGVASKIYNIFKQLLFAVVVVCLPRFSHMLANSKREEYESFAKKIYQTVFMLALPLVVAIVILSSNIIDIIAGNGFVDAIPTLKIKAFAILFAILSYFNMQLILLPSKKDTGIMQATLIAAIFNFIANAILIPFLKENGAAFTTAISELIVFLITRTLVKKIICISIERSQIIKTFFSTFMMGIVLVFINKYILNSIVCLVISFIAGILVYILMQIMLKNDILQEYFYDIKNFLRKK